MNLMTLVDASSIREPERPMMKNFIRICERFDGRREAFFASLVGDSYAVEMTDPRSYLYRLFVNRDEAVPGLYAPILKVDRTSIELVFEASNIPGQSHQTEPPSMTMVEVVAGEPPS